MHFPWQTQYKRGGEGADFLRGVPFLEHQIFRFAEMILRDRWAGKITFSWQALYFRQVDWQSRKTQWYEAVSSALNFPFLKEVSQNCSQNCFVLDVAKFKN